MIRLLTPPFPSELAKWCAYALLLLTPGSFFVLPVLWLIRRMPLRPRAGKGALQESTGLPVSPCAPHPFSYNKWIAEWRRRDDQVHGRATKDHARAPA